jgi:hypothetical protein
VSSHPGRFTPGEMSASTHYIGGWRATDGLDAMEKINPLASAMPGIEAWSLCQPSRRTVAVLTGMYSALRLCVSRDQGAFPERSSKSLHLDMQVRLQRCFHLPSAKVSVSGIHCAVSMIPEEAPFRMQPSGMLRHVAVVRTGVSEEHFAFIIRATRTGEVGTLAVTSNRRTRYVPPKRRFSREPHRVTSQKTSFFIVT